VFLEHGKRPRPGQRTQERRLRALHIFTVGIINTFISLILTQLEVLRGEIVLEY
jgi:hypothetical protein